jgi:hypothetical protein
MLAKKPVFQFEHSPGRNSNQQDPPEAAAVPDVSAIEAIKLDLQDAEFFDGADFPQKFEVFSEKIRFDALQEQGQWESVAIEAGSKRPPFVVLMRTAKPRTECVLKSHRPLPFQRV